MKALVIGATGAVGKDLVDLLLENDAFSEVHIFVRRKVENANPKLKVHLVDFDNVEKWKPLVSGDVAFSCLGTTLKAAGSKEAQWKIDYQYQYDFAQAASQNGVSQYVLVSASGANAQSFVFYSKMKGQLEEAIKKLNFSSLGIMQPPLLVRENSDRKGEKFAEKLLNFLNSVGLFRSQKPMHTQTLAQAMMAFSQKQEKGIFVFSPKAIRAINSPK